MTTGLFDENLRYVQDMLMWALIFLNRFPLFYLHDELVLSRIHGAQLTQTGRELFHKESKTMSEILLPALSECDEDIVFAFANYNATYNNKDAVNLILSNNSCKLCSVNRFKIRLKAVYGNIRPFIRKIYYKLFLKVNTQ